MRLLLIAVVLLSIGSIVSATYSTQSVENYKAHAHFISKQYSKGDNGDASGWRDCMEMENTGDQVGLVCEGVRTITTQRGNMVDVNYYCEFRFIKKTNSVYIIETEACQ
jgi:hypothetical protein